MVDPRASEQPMLSIVTVTSERLDLLKEKVASLLDQTLEPLQFEWLVWVNASRDRTLDYLQALEPPFALKVLQSSEKLAAGPARNGCARLARGRYLYFSDDDCVLSPGVLASHLGKQREGACAALGPIHFESRGLTRRWQPRRVRYWNFNGANSSLPREVFERVGGFDEGLQGYGGEDVLLGYRLATLGLPFEVAPTALVRHQGQDPVRAQNVEKASDAGRNAARIAAQVPELAFRLGVHPLTFALKRLLLSPPLSLLWRGLDRPSYTYEKAYFDAALKERKPHA